MLCDYWWRVYWQFFCLIALRPVIRPNLYAEGLKITEVTVPPHVIIGSTAKLYCVYDLEGSKLYAVKWFKNGKEFYHYIPGNYPPSTAYKVDGVVVDLERSDDQRVTLINASMDSSGKYMCEVSADEPTFQTLHKTTNMTVINLPDVPPIIHTSQEKYHVGETLLANCTTIRSYPPTDLIWFVNGKPVDDTSLIRYPPVEDGGEYTTTLGLLLPLNQLSILLNFPKDTKQAAGKRLTVNLRCSGLLGEIYDRSFEKVIFVDLQELDPPMIQTSKTRKEHSPPSSSSAISVPEWRLTLALTAIAAVDALRRQLIRPS